MVKPATGKLRELQLVEQEMLIETRDKLIRELENVNNPEYIEQQARSQLRLVMPGEVLYILPPDNAQEEE